MLTVDLALTITGLSDQPLILGETLDPFAFTIGGDSALLDDVTITAASSNVDLLPAAVILIGGTGANRTLTATPVPGASGTDDDHGDGDGRGRPACGALVRADGAGAPRVLPARKARPAASSAPIC